MAKEKMMWGVVIPPLPNTLPAETEVADQDIPPDSRLEKLKEKKEPSLGELNPLIFPPDLLSNDHIAALKLVTERKIAESGGLLPTSMGCIITIDNDGERAPRFVARFETDHLSEKQMVHLENLVAQVYSPVAVRTRKDTIGSTITPSVYPVLEKKSHGAKGTGLLGWYMGPEVGSVVRTHQGLFIYRDIGRTNLVAYFRSTGAGRWFFNDNLVTPEGDHLTNKYVIEVREASLYQTDLVEFITQVGSILGPNQKPVDDPKLLYHIYNDLNCLGLRKTNHEAVFGLDQQREQIQRELIVPLANIALSDSIALHPSSILLVGVPGTGKTEIVKDLLQRDTGVFLLPLDPKELELDLLAPAVKKSIIPRITRVFSKTNIPIVIHMDDVENLTQAEDKTNSTLLNLMKGIRDNGFFVIASTNKPEQLNPQLLQPERFGTIIYFPLQNEDARLGILNVHATRVSAELQRPLFTSEEERQLILQAVASDKRTKGYTPRFLADIATGAKEWYLWRLHQHRRQHSGLTEQDIPDSGFTFEVDDWEKALAQVDSKYDKAAVLKRDGEIANFAHNHHASLGFLRDNSESTINLHQDIAELVNRLHLRREAPIRK